MMLVMLLRYEDAVIALRRAHELDRLSPLISVEYANALTLAGRYDEALQELQGVRAVDPSNWKAYQGMAFVHAANSDWARAIAVLEEPPGHRPDRASYPWLGYYFAAAGRRADALRVLENFERRIEENETGDRSIDLAILHLGLGDRQKALDLLEVGFIERPADVTLTALLYPLLRDEPRYQAILSSMGLRFSDDA
jgi:tetratricopeptide (TPR) repeat protein